MKPRFGFLFFISLVLVSCKTQAPAGDDGKIAVTFIQVNDVYEIAPLEGGKTGGIARLATLKKQAQQKNPNTFLVMAGDFLSPSVYGTLTHEGKRIRGRQMIDAMNAAGFDFVCFGNHEFDIAEKDLQDRINESNFSWISANAFHKTDSTSKPFQHMRTGTAFPKYIIKTITDADGTKARIGIISVVTPSNPAEYVLYADPVTTAVDIYNLIKDSCDAVIGLTHLTVADDKRLANAAPRLSVIMGGHEHSGIFEKENRTFITKAQSNAKTAYSVTVSINTKRKKVKVDPRLVQVNESVSIDSFTNTIVQKWVSIANNAYAQSGFDAAKVLPYTGDPLEGRDEYTRSQPTNLTTLIANAMLNAAPYADAAVFNSGAIRLDDVLYPPITQYDILRTLPFGGGITEVDMKGSLLLEVLTAGLSNKNSGGWLQYGNISRDVAKNTWSVEGNAIDTNKVYRIVVPDFLLTGKEVNLSFFNEKNPRILKIYPAEKPYQKDIRQAIIMSFDYEIMRKVPSTKD